ncbi:MAG TPA: o-succinylbenzoate synthase [Gammaproteobacteria bacterium]|nr:o-succinylbenzoate synthase [Gammaproteobacteria bacterium]
MSLQLQLRPYALPLRQAWPGGGEHFAERRGLIVCVRDREGRYGYGDCAPLPGLGSETLAEARQALLHCQLPLRQLDAETALDALPLDAATTPAARCGLETAVLDLLARRQARPLYRWLDKDAPGRVKVNAMIGSLDEDSAARIAGMPGYSVFKFKLGMASLQQDIEQLQRLAMQLPGEIRLRLDANRAWTVPEAVRFIDACAGLPVDCLEEPLAQPTLEALDRLQARAGFALALDESLPHFAVDELVTSTAVQRLVLKPVLCGGLLPALAIARRAQAAGIGCVITTAVDSAVGVRAAAHLAAAVEAGGPGLAHGLATGAWLVQDVAEALFIEDGLARPGEKAGLGISSLQR